MPEYIVTYIGRKENKGTYQGRSTYTGEDHHEVRQKVYADNRTPTSIVMIEKPKPKNIN